MLSVVIITKNEAHNISDCLKSVAWANEIIVLDSGSEDNTIELCKAYTDKVFSSDWPGFGIQKQRALNKASCEWVLSIDADEQVTPQLKAEIEQVIHNNQFDGFEIPRLSRYCGKEIRHGGWWPDYVLRLFRRENGQFSPDVVHERVIVTGTTAKLTQPLLHEAFINSAETLHKINSYSSLGARKLYEAGKTSSVGVAIGKGLWTFVRTSFLRAGFLDGGHGLMLAISSAEAAYYKYIKLLELQNLPQQKSHD